MRTSATPPRRGRLLGHLLTSLLVLSLAAGCRSTQSVYRVLPATGPVVAAQAPSDASAAPSVAPTPAKAAARPHRVAAAPGPRLAVPGPRLVAPEAAPLLARTAPPAKSRLPLLRAAKRAVRRAAPHNTAEAGLGTTLLGILGILAIPVGLIGLLLSGGLAWAIVAIVGGLLLLNAIYEPFVD